MINITLDINPETVCFIIDKAHEIHTQEQGVTAEDTICGGDKWDLQIPGNPSDDLTYMELKSTIMDLEPDQQIMLVALMWLGRGVYDVDEWESALSEAQDSWNMRTAEYLIGTPLVADYLTEGLSLLGYSCNE